MIISLDKEISVYKPYGRKIADSIPNFNNRSKKNVPESEISDSKIHFSNDFIAAELDTSRDLFRSINDVLISKEASFSSKDFWRIRNNSKGEEELYINDNCVILSYKQSNGNGNSFLDKTFTFSEKVIDAIWCDFVMNDNINSIVSHDFSNLMFKEPQKDSSLNNYPKFLLSSPKDSFNTKNEVFFKNLNIAKSLVVMDKYSIHILLDNGNHYKKALQFEVKKILPTNYGLFLERVLNDNENQLDNTVPAFPMIFSLSNPLNDISPVLISNSQSVKGTSNIGYITKFSNYSLVSVIEDKNLVIFYCSKTGSHVIYFLRPINNLEVDWIQKDLQKSCDDISLDRTEKSMDLDTDLNLVSTPIANGDPNKKQCRLSYTSPVTRSMSNNIFNNLTKLGSNNKSSSPLASASSSLINSPHNSRQSLTNELNLKRTLSPFSNKISSLISSRIDSPASPSLNRLPFSIQQTESKIFDSGHDMRVNMTNANFSNSSIKNLNCATPTITRNHDSFIQKFSEPIIAEFALEYVWSEMKMFTNQYFQTVAASKAFVSCDFLGQQYLCLLVKQSGNLLETSQSSILKLIKFDQSSVETDCDCISNRTRYIFSSTKILNVCDAEPLKALNMIIVLDETNALVLYSGIYKVAIINLSSSASLTKSMNKKFNTPKTQKFLNSDIESPSFDSIFSMGASQSSFKSNDIQTSSPIISMLDSNNASKSNSYFNKESDNLLFSIQQYPFFGKIVSLSDCIDNRVTFETEDSQLFRISFPSMASTFLVDKCLAALRQTLPKDIVLQFIKSWYTHRNSTNKDENISEIILFKLCLLSSIGYEYESVKEEFSLKDEISVNNLSNTYSKALSVSSPLTIGHSESLEKEITKKMKIQDDANDDDWRFFVRHSTNLYGLTKSHLLSNKSSADGSQTVKIKSRKSTKSKRLPKQSTQRIIRSLQKSKYTFNSPLVLYPYMPHILYALHLIYEDLKLIQMNWSLCKTIVDVLYLLAVDLDLPLYQDHYMRDFPSVCIEISPESEPCLVQHKSKLIYPQYFSQRPPSIYQTLYSYLNIPKSSSDNHEVFPFIGSGGSVSKTLTSWGAHVVTPNIFNLTLLYSNLNQEELVDPQLVLHCIGNNILMHSNSSTTYINVEKFKQIMNLYSPVSRCSLSDSLTGFPIKKQARKFQSICDIHRPSVDYKTQQLFDARDPQEKILFLMSALGVTQDYIKQLPFGLALPLWSVIFDFRVNPKNDWCSSIYSLIGRPDLLLLEYPHHFSINSIDYNDEVNCLSDDDESELAYIDFSVLRLLFPNDQRLQEAYQLLASSRAVNINIKQAPGVSDSDFADEQEKHLYALSIRTMALPLGRGMVTLRSYTPVVVERFPIPPLVLIGRAPPRTVIEISHIDVPQNMNVWPLFHNGVAAGLRIASNPNKMVDSSWILFNKPTANIPVSDEHYTHAGFLLALGLNGMLDKLPTMELHDYLSKGNDLTKVAILLGLAACKRGTMDSSTYVLLGIHLEGLLPSTSTEINVSPIVKVAAVLGLGLLFQGTGQSYIAEVMLNEIGRPPGPEMEHYIDRESYALSAGLAFGMVTLGRGNEMMNMLSSEGIPIPDQLNHYMLGVHKKLSVIQKEKNKTPSYHIREGDCINADVTSPGATLALGMMFFDTGNKAIAQWLNIPETQNLLEMVRPDFILLRVLAKNLILWSDIKPTSEWIESHIPPIIYKNAFQKLFHTSNMPSGMIHDEIDYETMTQSYCNIIAGACFALALKYAGSADQESFEVVHKYTVKLVTLNQKGSSANIEQAGRSTVESCLNVLIVSCSIIMAGTGHEEVMRLCRYLRSRINQGHVLYGSFMAIHLALGLLFLGGCRITLNNSPESVAALICAFFPKYPIHTIDNRYHLQAFRHLYVLATQPRLLVPRCIETGIPVYATIRYKFSGSSNFTEKFAPCLLPDLNLLDSIELIDNNYWKISFERSKNFNKLLKCLKYNGNFFVKRKVKGISHNKDIIYQALDSNDLNVPFITMFHKMDRKSFTLFDLTNEVVLKTFSQIFISHNTNNDKELQVKHKLCSILYECAEDETMELFVPLVKLISASLQMIELKKRSQSVPDSSITVNKFEDEIYQKSFQKYFTIWQIKFAYQYLNKCEKNMPKFSFIKTIQHQLEKLITSCLDKDEVVKYLRKQIQLSQANENLIDAVVFYNLPSEGIPIPKDMKFITLLNTLRAQSPTISVSTVSCLFDLLRCAK